jgi:hypothetical protein
MVNNWSQKIANGKKNLDWSKKTLMLKREKIFETILQQNSHQKRKFNLTYIPNFS